MSDNRYYVNYLRETTAHARWSPNQFNSRRRPPSRNPFVEGRQPAPVMNRQTYQVSVRNLLMPRKPQSSVLQRIRKRN